MQSNCHIPNSLRSAGRELRSSLRLRLEQLQREKFVRLWSAVAYLFPRLHPDEFAGTDGGWPRKLKPIVAEAWRRAEMEELTDEELYPCDAQWCGVYDRINPHLPDEIERRLALAADFGEVLQVHA